MRRPLLFYVSWAGDRQRTAVGPALAAAAERSGWSFECYYDTLRRGRHFGGGDPEAARPGWSGGSLVSGGRHADLVLWLAADFELVALGDPASILWPALEAAGAEILVPSTDPAELYSSAFERVGQPLPRTVLVVDAAPQGERGLVVAPYLYPAFLAGEPVLGAEAGCDEECRGRLETLGALDWRGLFVGPQRAEGFPGGLALCEGEVGGHSYASLTGELADRHAGWGHGVLLGDPDLVASQLPKARRLRLLPLYGRPQTTAIERTRDLVARASEPVYGRQYDDRDFFELARLGRSLQVIDPGPPFDAAASAPTRLGSSSLERVSEPSDDELRAWAEEGRVLTTLLFWAGMVRELDAVPRIVDLVAATGVAAGLVLTAESLEHGRGFGLDSLGTPVDRGGVLGLLEPLLGSAGRGVAAEWLVPAGGLRGSLAEARAAAAALLPTNLEPEGWWPLLDAPLVPSRARPVTLRSGRPRILFTPRGGAEPGPLAPPRTGRDPRGAVGLAVRGLGLTSLFEQRRPFDAFRPGPIDDGVAEAVRDAGFSYMWSKAEFGRPAVVFRTGDFVALSFTAGRWDGWSPFYTVARARDLDRAERRLLRRRRPGWLASTIDSPLWLLSGESLEHGSDVYRLAERVAGGGRSRRLVNVAPRVVARYARLLDDLGALT